MEQHNKQDAPVESAIANEKKPYRAPELTIHGTVAGLTMALNHLTGDGNSGSPNP